MRTWSQDAKQSLRLLAAARYFLPNQLDCPVELEQQFQSHLRQLEFQSALEILEHLGDRHSGYDNESIFWKEMYYAAQHMGLPEHASRYEERIRQVAEMQRLQF